ncbi:DNA helicase PIF1, ATP-dependent [Tanacetum coccineum]|uniref:ATP-dependent DNA helicase n=1 Tax=Tanacetum coccineum TaxID=301880 RepID=A0ABQ5CQL1_9ASTR
MKSKFSYQKESKSQQMQRQIKSESKSHSRKMTVKQTPAMTPNAKLTPIKDISPMVTNMRIRGRGDRIQAYIEKDWMFRFEPLLQDGIFYVISNFGVTENVDQIDDNLIGFKNEPFTRILDTDEEYEENNSIGIGDVVAVNSIGARKIRRTIVIEDEEGERINLTFWDSWANKWNEYTEKFDTVGHIDVMLMLGKVKYWNNAPSVHNCLFGTQMYINKSIPKLLSFRQRYEGREEYDANEHKIQLVAHETKIVTPREFMHGEVKKLVGSIRETEPETECVIYMQLFIASNTKAVRHTSVTKYVAKKLFHLLLRGHPLLRLNKHGGVKSMKVKTKLLLVMDESESAQLCIFDGSMYKMSGYTAWELVEKHGADTATYFPGELNCIIGKKFLFRVKFTEYNHKNNSHVYKYERVTNDEIIMYWKQGFATDYEESEEDSEDELTTPAIPIKTKKVLDLSLTRRLQLTSPSTCNIGSSSDDDKSPNSKKPFDVLRDEEPQSQRQCAVKLEKNLEKDVEKDLDKNVEKDVENDEEPKFFEFDYGCSVMFAGIFMCSTLTLAFRVKQGTSNVLQGSDPTNTPIIATTSSLLATPQHQNVVSSSGGVSNITPRPVGHTTHASTIVRTPSLLATPQHSNVVASSSGVSNIIPRSVGRPRKVQHKTPTTETHANTSAPGSVCIPHQANIVASSTTPLDISLRRTTRKTPPISTALKGKMPLYNQRSRFRINTPVKFNIDDEDEVESQSNTFEGISNEYRDHGDPIFGCESCGALLWHAKSSVGKIHIAIQNHTLYIVEEERMGSLLPDEGKPPMFSQLYIYDTENEVQNRIKFACNGQSTSSDKKKIDHQLTTEIRDMLDTNNPLVAKFRTAGERFVSKNLEKHKAKTYWHKGSRWKKVASEVAALIVGDFDSTKHKRDIILKREGGDLKQISELHPSYLALQYPLLFPYAQDGYRTDIYHRGVTDLTPTNKKTRQFLVDGYTMIESERMSYIRREQKDLRSETYSKLAKLAADPDSGVTIRDLFITFTCNPNWPEIARFVAEKGLKSEDRPDVITRVFKQKLDSLMKDFKEKRWFGRLRGAVYTVEFQKRGLPHAHILLFLEPEDKLTTAAHIDKYISAEIPDKDEDPELYQIVTDHMMHGPCGAERQSCPCTVNKKCTKKFPKQFNETTFIDESGYAIYKRRNDGGIFLHAKQRGGYTALTYITGFHPLRGYRFTCLMCNRSYSMKVKVLTTHLIRRRLMKQSFKTDTFAQTLLYIEIPKYYVWKHDEKVWQKRQKGESIGRIHHVPPSWGEMFYLRVLLNKVRGAMDWDDFKEFEGVVYPTFKDACYARGLLEDDKEYIDGLLEASHWGMGNYLRRFFVMLIMTDSMSRPEFVYEKTWHVMATDVESIERVKKNAPELVLSDEAKKNYCLLYIEHMLLSNNKSLKNIPNMPFPIAEYTMDGYNRLVHDELSYNTDELKLEHKRLYVTLTDEQKGIYGTILDSVDKNKGGMFFIYRYGGTGKTYLYRTMSAACRSKGGIVLNVASSGIAALLLEGGRTTHSRFAIPINVVEDSMCNISADSELAELLRMTKLIIWDEAPMVNRHCYEAFDRTMRDICRTDPSMPSEQANVEFLMNMLIPDSNDHIGSIIHETYPDLLQNIYDSDYFQERAILAPTHELVDMINDRMLSLLHGDEKTYNSSDTVGVADVDTNFNETMYT